MSTQMKESKVSTRTLNMIARGVLEATDDSAGVQVLSLSILDGERKDNVERVQNYGFTSHPSGEAEAIVIFPGGDRSAGVVVALDERATRMTGLSPGEVAIYTNEGDSIVLGVTNEITVTTRRMIITASEAVRMETPLLEVTGDIVDHADDGRRASMLQMRDVYNMHSHSGAGAPPSGFMPLANDNETQ
jgi:phage baseplate assembly protein V